jgi:hypothetical protein
MSARQLWMLTLSLAIAGTALADTAYLKPSNFSPEINQTVTIEAAFSDFCCEPEHPVRTPSFAVITPDGQQSVPERTETFATMTVLEQTIRKEGTTRITTGERLGRKGEYVLLDGRYHLVNSPDAEPVAIPAGTPILSSQTATLSDTYLTAGSATWKAVRVPVGRLRIEPFVHPNKIKTGSVFSGRVTLDGAPVTDQKVVMTDETQRLRGVPGQESRTNQAGEFSIVFSDPGTALIMTRLQAPAPDGAETDIRSYTTSLTINVSAD